MVYVWQTSISDLLPSAQCQGIWTRPLKHQVKSKILPLWEYRRELRHETLVFVYEVGREVSGKVTGDLPRKSDLSSATWRHKRGLVAIVFPSLIPTGCRKQSTTKGRRWSVFNKKMSCLQCAFNWINFSFITQSLKPKHIGITRQALLPGREQQPNYFITILNYPISSRLADDHNIAWGHHGKKYSSAKSFCSRCQVLSGDLQALGEGQQAFFVHFLPKNPD